MAKQKENLNSFGLWIDTIARILGIYWRDISRRTTLDRSTIPQLAHATDKRASRQTIESIWRSIQSIASEKGVPFSMSIETAFMNGMGYSTQIQIETSGMHLNALRAQHGLPALEVNMDHLSDMAQEAARQEIDELRYELRRKEERIAELEQELKKWRS